jgi:integrase
MLLEMWLAQWLKGLKPRLERATYKLDTGMRQGELLSLHWNDVDFVEGSVYVRRALEEIDGDFNLKSPKTEKSRRRI